MARDSTVIRGNGSSCCKSKGRIGDGAFTVLRVKVGVPRSVNDVFKNQDIKNCLFSVRFREIRLISIEETNFLCLGFFSKLIHMGADCKGQYHLIE